MTALLYFLGLAAFVLAIAVSIGLHELGHLVPARMFGARVTQFFVGFGSTLFSRQVGETEVGIKALPVGGFVKIVGMLPPGPAGERRDSNTGMFTQLIADARAADAEHVRPGDEDRLFYRLPWWKKVIVMAGGPTVNLVIAFILYLIIFGAYGVRTVEPATGAPVLAEVTQCVIPYVDHREVCRETDPQSPAAKAGLRPGDIVTSFNGSPVTSWDQLRALVRHNGNAEAAIGYRRDGQDLVGHASTTVQARPTSQSDLTLTRVGFLGVTPTSREVVTHEGPWFTLQEMGGMARDSVVGFVHLPVKVWGVAKAIVGVEKRDPQGPVSIVGGGRIAGEAVSEKSFPVLDKVVFLVGLIAGFNLFVGLFNFIPLLPLDGGHIASALWEGLRRGWARLWRRPDPGHVDPAALLPVAYVVASALLVMGLVLIVGDLVVPVHMQSN